MENLNVRKDHFTVCGHLLAQVHDQTLLNINNHLVNGGANELDGVARGGGNQLTTLKEEILTELERRVSLSCSACQVKPNLGHKHYHRAQTATCRCTTHHASLLIWLLLLLENCSCTSVPYIVNRVDEWLYKSFQILLQYRLYAVNTINIYVLYKVF